MSFIEIPAEEITAVKDGIRLFKEGGAALVRANGKTNALTVAWGSLGVLWRKPTLTLYIHKTRYSKELFDACSTFSYNVLIPSQKKALSNLGSASGRNEDKIKGSGLTLMENEAAPYFKESQLVILCSKMGQTDFHVPDVDESVKDWYEEEGVHTLYFGEIVKVLKRVED